MSNLCSGAHDDGGNCIEAVFPEHNLVLLSRPGQPAWLEDTKNIRYDPDSLPYYGHEPIPPLEAWWWDGPTAH